MIVTATLYEVNKEVEASLAVVPSEDTTKSYKANLVGGIAVSGNPHTSPDRQPGFFFVFENLCIRRDGEYCLKFQLYRLGCMYYCL